MYEGHKINFMFVTLLITNIVLQTVKSFITKHQLLDKLDQIGLAISGGKDSVCMAYLLEEMQLPFVMVHVNFGLRSTESDADALFVRTLGTQLSYCTAVYTKEVDTNAYAKDHKMNIQLAAREIRYAYFEELKSDGKITKLITAHHQSDMVETFFINLNRQTGINGLKSIPMKRDFIIRPLLALTGQQVKDYLKQNNITHREDSSNASDTYARNQWRNSLLPKVVEHLPNFEQNTVSSIHILQQENEALTWLVQEKIAALVTHEENTLTIDSERIRTYPQGAVFLYRILDNYEFNYPQCEQMLESSTSTGALFYSSTHQLLINRKTFIVQKYKTQEFSAVAIDSAGDFTLGEHMLEIKKTTELIFSNDPKEETVGISPELFPLSLRYWQEGDRIQPLGMKGSKLLSDFFIDQKINVLDKHQTPLLCKDDEVLWICGMRVSEKLRAKPGTIVYKLTMK
jgi:tRNA(Ile)-lysidine synthase